MKNILWLNIAIVPLFLFWFFGMFIIAISGSHNSPGIRDMFVKFLLAHYPLGIAFLFYLFNLSFFGMRSSVFLLIVALLVIVPNHFLFNAYVNDYFLLRGRSIHGAAITDEAVYFNTRLVKQADPKTFKKIDHPKGYKNYSYHQKRFFYTDRNHVFRDGKIVEGADPESFVVHSNEIASDKNMVYYIRYNDLIELKHLDPKTLVVDWPEGSYHDKDNYYIGTVRLDVPKDFKRIGRKGVSEGFIWKFSHPGLKDLKLEEIEITKVPYPGDVKSTEVDIDTGVVRDKDSSYEYSSDQNRYIRLSE